MSAVLELFDNINLDSLFIFLIGIVIVLTYFINKKKLKTYLATAIRTNGTVFDFKIVNEGTYIPIIEFELEDGKAKL